MTCYWILKCDLGKNKGTHTHTHTHTLQDIINVSTQDVLWGQQLDQWSLGLEGKVCTEKSMWAWGLGDIIYPGPGGSWDVHAFAQMPQRMQAHLQGNLWSLGTKCPLKSGREGIRDLQPVPRSGRTLRGLQEHSEALPRWSNISLQSLPSCHSVTVRYPISWSRSSSLCWDPLCRCIHSHPRTGEIIP